MDRVISANELYLGYNSEDIVISRGEFDIYEKDFVFISGPSGSGKSTLLKSLYGALRILDGNLEVCGMSMANLNRNRLSLLRKHIGVVFQDYKLIHEWNVEKNVMLPLLINGYSKEVCKSQTEKLLSHVRLSHKAHKYPKELSGGEQQRVALARALAHNPVLLLADEPTGNLDDYSSEMVWDLLVGASSQLGMSVVVVTHRVPDYLGINYRHFHIAAGEIDDFL
ncbi:MAG: cell division ATP-binding protein FtsE [Campylobacterales bacterium]